MNIKIHIVAPYESMIPVIEECIGYFPTFEIRYSIGDLHEGVKQAIQAVRNGAEIIISRGGTAKLIKKNVRVPVLDMQLSGYDMIRSLSLATNLESKTAIVGFSNITSGAQSIIDLLDLPLKVFTVADSDEVAPLILELKNSGYQQIVGDVITVKTSNAYGLKGFLIQSGKESIMNALEDAKLVHHYLNDKNNLMKVMEQFILKDHQNLLILDDKNEIIYERWNDFHTSPLTEADLYILITDLEINKQKVTRSFMIQDHLFDVTGYFIQVNQQSFKVIVTEKTVSILEQKGLSIDADTTSEPIAAASEVIRNILIHIETLYKNNQIILLQGRKGTSKDFITRYIHQRYSDEGLLLTINFKEFDHDYLDKMPLRNIRTIRLIHPEYIDEYQRLSHFIKECLTHHIRIFILTESMLPTEFIQEVKMNKIIMPDLSERKEDIRILAQYFIAYYNQKYGTIPVKINGEAIQFLENFTYPNNIDNLKNLIKQVALNEKDYVIQKETIERVATNEHLPADVIFQQGTLKEIEKEIIKLVLKAENNNQTRAAERLGINRATLWRKLKE
ncbi:sigma-54-dependent Fis family transcriptional regulator [Bacillus sp. HNG]|uniref:sigma-54-dependent Fis family transcriptional regulator n=1 Tax=Bacillus sp. HNG TaxID=2293325 RepID=UPI001CB99022|nr:sigma-54-dependent Fis family transcriptional regulator [Bacillus sp. HNG]